MDFFNYKRRLSSVVHIGNTPLGGSYPIRIQSMANVPTMDTLKAVAQAIRMIHAGAQYVRFTAQGEREARDLHVIRETLRTKGYDTPLIADIHFNPAVADIAATAVEKVRINPGNYVDRPHTSDYTEEAYDNDLQKLKNRLIHFLDVCRKHQTVIRIGVNHGSLSDRIMNRYGDTPEGMVESCMEVARLCAEEKFDNVVLSVKSSNTTVMIRTVRLLVQAMEAEGLSYPLHLGVTEAGDGEDGRIKSAVGIGTLLTDGYGDTIRVSLSEAPEAELPVAQKLVDHIAACENHTPIIAAVSPLYNPFNPVRRKSRTVCGIGGDNPPVVISDRRNAVRSLNKDGCPDWIFTTIKAISDGFKSCSDHTPFLGNYIVEAKQWRSQPTVYPYFSASEINEFKNCTSEAKFISLTYNDLNDDVMQILKEEKNAIVIASSSHIHYTGEMRAFMHRLLNDLCDVPVILSNLYADSDLETIQIKAATDFGALLTDGFGDGLLLSHPKKTADQRQLPIDNCMFGILQATRTRISKTEYISCPGCGRTLFDLHETIARIKAATAHLKGLKIGIMGCIVNGPGEMADADYGYVGAGRGRINLYQGKICIQKNIPEAEAVNQLLKLINKQSL